MKWKYILLTFTVLSSIFLGLVQFDIFKNILSDLVKDSIFLKISLFVIVIGSTLMNLYVTYINPQNRLEKATSVINNQLLHTAEQLINSWKAKGYIIKFNVMEIETYKKGYLLLDPDENGNGKFKLFPLIFKCTWTAPKNHSLPKGFFLGIRQGSSGKALNITAEDADDIGKKTTIATNPSSKEKILDLAMYSLEGREYEYARTKLNLNKKQFQQTEKTKLLFSLPVYIRKDEDRLTKLVSVITLESEDSNLANLTALDITQLDETKDDEKALKEKIVNMKNNLMETIGEIRDTYARLYF